MEGFGKGKRGLPSVSPAVVSIIMILFTAFIAGGGIYDLLDNPPSLYPSGNRWVAVHPFQSDQTINESIVSMLLTLFMVGGLIIAYKSTKVSNDSRKANSMVVIGITLILMGLAGSHYLLLLKSTIGR
ncbi:hypothetical protein CL673_01765 [Candidatus Bathyarchaeota archaeon]|nr:hypothetical protein [Candidatus Bathyarchaeota archaeon]MDP6048342.1 hypothetical protein [Candidatus Bathyarchaeota archaeon]MDP6457941.1 hypothetical protein [Candidatus Bathyarchaeota archaeon]MDP7206964.1 hypothetical protein [Candidatus Bathyarchaeota archaeon]MDP7442749.1 hypothetical protein [Candidatus Bathyarchaeota archaeon]